MDLSCFENTTQLISPVKIPAFAKIEGAFKARSDPQHQLTTGMSIKSSLSLLSCALIQFCSGPLPCGFFLIFPWTLIECVTGSHWRSEGCVITELIIARNPSGIRVRPGGICIETGSADEIRRPPNFGFSRLLETLFARTFQTKVPCVR